MQVHPFLRRPQYISTFLWITPAQCECQDEVDGLIFYGFWENEFSNEVLKNLEAFASFWVDSEISVKPRIWEGNDNANLSIEVHIIKWPIKNWLLCVEKSLKWFVELGAKVAWCGAEYSSPSLGSFRALVHKWSV